MTRVLEACWQHVNMIPDKALQSDSNNETLNEFIRANYKLVDD